MLGAIGFGLLLIRRDKADCNDARDEMRDRRKFLGGLGFLAGFGSFAVLGNFSLFGFLGFLEAFRFVFNIF